MKTEPLTHFEEVVERALSVMTQAERIAFLKKLLAVR